MRIVRWDVENVKRIKAVRIDAEGAMIQITGRNEQGKSSVIDALEMALAGKRSECPDPVRRGTESAKVIVELDDLTVTKKWNKAGKSSLIVKAKDGTKYQRPQEILDKLVGQLSFDPLAFMQMAPPFQMSMLQQIAGLNFDSLEVDRQRVFDNRTETNRDLKKYEAGLEQMASWANGPDKEVSVVNLVTLRDELTTLANERESLEERISDNEVEIANAKELIELRKSQIEKANARLKEVGKPDVDTVTKSIANAEETNTAARNKVRYNEGRKKRDELQVESNKQSARLAAIDKEKVDMVEAADMPIDGLSFGDGEVLYDGLSLANASQSKQLRISAAIGLAVNPKLKILLIRNGSLLDSDAMTELEEFATEQDAQIVIERVTDGEAIGVVIEDGEVWEPDNQQNPEDN